MKTKIQLCIFLLSILLLTVSNLYSQSCTQCDNTGNPPGTLASEIGQNTTASGSYSFAGGINSTAEGGVSFAFGSNAYSQSAYAISIGSLSSALKSNSFALGSFCTSNGTNSFVLGNGLNSSTKLTNSVDNSLMIGFYSDKPTLFIGESNGIGSTGKIGIGDITNPQAKLHIKADDGEQAALFIEPHMFGGSYDAQLWMGTSAYGLRAAYGKLYFNTGGHYIFNSPDANMGIGVLIPSEKLEVNGNINISKGYALFADRIQGPGQKGLNLAGLTGIGIYVAYNGKVGIGLTNPTSALEVNGKIKGKQMQITTGYGNGKLLQSDAVGNAVWTNPAWIISGNNVYRTTGNVGIGTPATSNRLEVAGTVNATNFVGDGTGLYNVPGDDLGSHIATQNIQMSGRWLSGDGGDEGIFVKNDGNVGIGLSVPECKLDIAGELRVYNIIEGNQNGGYNKLIVKGCDNANSSLIEIFKGGTPESRSIKLITRDGGDIQFSTSSTRRMIIRDDEIVIGQADVQKHVDVRVNGHLLCREVEVTPTEWYDQVFDSDYQLTALNDLEKFIKDNGHLPEIPTDEQVMGNGINVGEMQSLLLKKIEELTLYVIELKNENYEMKRDIVELKNDKL